MELVEDSGRPFRVLGLPHAGAGCATLAECAGMLGADIALWGLNLPGRQARFGETPITDLAELVSKVTSALRHHVDRPYILFGHCSGALLAYLVTVAARAAGLPPPKSLVVASYPAPHLAVPPRELHRLPSDDFWREITSFGGLARELTDSDEYREIFEPILRADYQALSTYRHVPTPPLDIPIVVVAGRQDSWLDQGSLAAWSSYTTAASRLSLVDGGHWLLDSACAEVARVLEVECRR